MKYNHVGIPTTAHFDGEIPLPHLKVTVAITRTIRSASSGKGTGTVHWFLTW